MKRFLSGLLIITIVASFVACSGRQSDTIETTPLQQQEVSNTAIPSDTPAPTHTPTLEPEPEPYTPMDLLNIEFNPYAEMQLPDNFVIQYASFNKGSAKLEGKNPFILTISAEGNMFAAVAYLADVSGLSEQEKGDRIDEYSKSGFCEFTGTDGRIVTIRQQKPHDEKYENGACLIDLTYYVPDAELERYTDLIRDNYNLNALTAVKDFFNVETDFSECSIEVVPQNNEANVAVQYYVDDADSVQQRVAEIITDELQDWHGLPSAVIPYGLIKNTLIFDSRFGAAILVLQTSNELNSSLGEYVEPEFSLTKFGFHFDDAGTCGVYEEREPYYKSVAIHRPEWGEHPDGWNIEFMDMVNGYGLRITYHEPEKMYHISLDKDGGASYDYYPATGEHGGHPDNVGPIFNEVFGTSGDEFYVKPLAYFEQFVQDRFGMSIEELYALPKQ